MNYTALSLSQTPQLSVPMPYFLAAPLFFAAAALLLLFSGPELLQTRWTPSMLALTHLVTLGFLGTVMLGALQQLIPVLVGVPLSWQRGIGLATFLLWFIGVALLVAGMVTGMATGVQGGGALIGLSLLLLLPLVFRSLFLSSSGHATVTSMALALLALTVAAVVALYLLFRFNGQLPLAHPFTTLHVGWAGLGWIFLLLSGVAYQVVPMFQITPEYPPLFRRWLGPLSALTLLLWSGQTVWPVLTLMEWLLLLPPLLFAVQTLRLQAKRRRRLSDVTLDFWRLAMGSLMLAAAAWAGLQLYPSGRLELVVGLLFFFGFAASAVNGMLYKIVPFLVWLHLNNRLQQAGRWQGRVPNMKQVIPELQARRQYRLHVAALVLLLLTLIVPALPYQLAAGAWLLSALVLGWNLLQALRLYWRVVDEQDAASGLR